LEIGVTGIEHEPNAIERSMLDRTIAPCSGDGSTPEQPHDPTVVAIQPLLVPATFRLPTPECSEAERQRRWLREFLERHKDADDPSQWEDLSHLTPEEIVRKLSS